MKMIRIEKVKNIKDNNKNQYILEFMRKKYTSNA